MKLYVKFMICPACKNKIIFVLEELAYRYVSVEKGEIVLIEDLNEAQFKLLSTKLQNIGYEIFKNKNESIVEDIKNCITENIYHSNSTSTLKISTLLTDNFCQTYNNLSIIFKKDCKITISKFTKDLKIKKIKEMLSYHDQSLTKIAYSMHFASVQAICKFFKKANGYTTTDYNKMINKVIKIKKKKK